MTRVSDLYIELIPPNPLELQVTVAGAYESLTWSRGGMELAGSGSVSFSDFRQTLTVSNTSAEDAGEYTAAVSDSESVIFVVQEFRESMSVIIPCDCALFSIGLILSLSLSIYICVYTKCKHIYIYIYIYIYIDID